MTTKTSASNSTSTGTKWWPLALRGVLAIVFGILALLAPVAVLASIALVFGVYAVIDGIIAIWQALQSRGRGGSWGWLLFQGIVSVLAGIAAAVFPLLAGTVGGLFALWTIVIYAIMHGASGIAFGLGDDSRRGKGWSVLYSAITLLFGLLLGVLIFVSPGATLMSLVWVVGVYAIVFGLMLIVAAIRRRTSAA